MLFKNSNFKKLLLIKLSFLAQTTFLGCSEFESNSVFSPPEGRSNSSSSRGLRKPSINRFPQTMTPRKEIESAKIEQ
jgi:hypothetical protein